MMLNNKYFNNYENKLRLNISLTRIQKSTFKGTYFNKIIEFKRNIKKCKIFVVCIGENFGKARHLTSKFLEKFGLKPLTLINWYSLIGNKTTVEKVWLQCLSVTLMPIQK